MIFELINKIVIIKKKTFLPFVTAWRELRTITVSEINQSVKTNTIRFHLLEEYNKQNKVMRKIELEA